MRFDVPSPEVRAPREPVFNGFPLVVIVLSGAIIAVSMLDMLVGGATRDFLWNLCVVAYDPYTTYVGRPLGDIGPLFLHVFLHGGFFHLIMNMAMMVAFGPAIAKALGTDAKGAAAFLAFFFLCSAAGALAELGWAMWQAQAVFALGASSGLSGFFAAGGWLMGGVRGALRLSLPWLVINLVIAFAGPELTQSLFGMRLAWAAHVGGLVAGFVLFPVFLKLMRPNVRLFD
ncbi:rhomboid family intramembrane serine protease [Henriciella sp. AS95]|uniref:rhomboid family intramembrane serine protease n=1 Tax=Henriciella sp. AS95 TaxID=3135782 RepID=UPI00316B5A53